MNKLIVVVGALLAVGGAAGAAVAEGAVAAGGNSGVDYYAEAQSRTAPKEFVGADGKVFRYRIAEKLPQDGAKVPLVLFLHGSGARGTNNVRQLKYGVGELLCWLDAHEKGYRVVAGQVPEGKRWVEVDWSAKSHDMPVEPSETMALLMEFLDAQLADTAVDASRVFVTGISMGGYGTWDLLCRRPEVFAAAMPVCGGADVAQASKIAKVPIWVFHGDSDSTVPVCRSRNMVSALWQCGGKVRYREYPGVGHNCWTQTYADKDVLKWFFEQRKTPDLAAQGAEIAVHRGRADATGVFSVDGGEAVTFDGKFVLPDGAKRVDISLSPDGTRRGVRSSGNYHDLTDDALRLHGMFTNETNRVALGHQWNAAPRRYDISALRIDLYGWWIEK